MNITAAVITLQVLPFDVKSEADYLAAVMAHGPATSLAGSYPQPEETASSSYLGMLVAQSM